VTPAFSPPYSNYNSAREPVSDPDSQNFERILAEIRPVLHRYCARMVGSAVDGEDVVQDALMKAFTARASADTVVDVRAWLFRIAHNAALDFLRRRARHPDLDTHRALDMVPAPDHESPDPEIVRESLHRFMRLPTLQRTAVILKDVLGYSVEDVASIAGTTSAAVKSALQRGREHLRATATEGHDLPAPALSDSAQHRLAAYVDGFNRGDFDAVRAMLAEDVKLDLVTRLKRRGRSEVGEYLGRYATADQWTFAAGTADGRSAMLVYDRTISLESPAYFVVLEFDGGQVTAIRDFLLARYAMEGVDLRPVAR
jgi:RNA polymerase sigma-70 factor (ECF subfamily)